MKKSKKILPFVIFNVTGVFLNGKKRPGLPNLRLFRQLSQDYRIICIIEDEMRVIEMLKAGHRKEIYR
jgi:mRNA-degrading endonuclease RelE of RelBE toxin-antitoxin system